MTHDDRLSEDRRDEDDAEYWRRRAAEELAHADKATRPDAAAAHRAIAAAYRDRADQTEPDITTRGAPATPDSPSKEEE